MTTLREQVEALEGRCHDGEGLGCAAYPCVENVDRDEVLAIVDATLDAAWAEAEAALPEGWFIGGLELLRLPTRNRPLWRAMAVQPMTIGGGRVSGEVDASPAAALLALAAKLRENH